MISKSKKIRIMHVSSYIGYDGPSRGIIGQIKYTNKQIFQPIVCEIKSTKHKEPVKLLTEMGCEHISLNRNSPYDISIIIRLAKLFRKEKVDIVNTHNSIACWYGNIAARIVRIPVVFTLRNLQSVNYELLLGSGALAKLSILLDRYTMKISDMNVAISEKLRNYYIEKERLSPNEIMAINNAIDLEPFNKNYPKKETREKLGIKENAIVIGIVGDLLRRKGHTSLIEAARIIIKQNQNVAFLIVGDGPLKKNLIEKVDEYGISDHFIWTGHVKDVIPLLSIMDIFVLPSLAEGISRALMEAMAMGLPAVCSAIDGNMEAIIDGDTGLIFPVNNYELLAEKLFILINDEKERRQMGEKAREKIEKEFDMKIYARKYENLYLEVLNEWRPVGLQLDSII